LEELNHHIFNLSNVSVINHVDSLTKLCYKQLIYYIDLLFY